MKLVCHGCGLEVDAAKNLINSCPNMISQQNIDHLLIPKIERKKITWTDVAARKQKTSNPYLIFKELFSFYYLLYEVLFPY